MHCLREMPDVDDPRFFEVGMHRYIGHTSVSADIGRYQPISVSAIKLTLTDGSSRYLSVVDRHTFCAGYIGVMFFLLP